MFNLLVQDIGFKECIYRTKIDFRVHHEFTANYQFFWFWRTKKMSLKYHCLGHRNLDSGGHTGFAKNDQFLGQGWQSFIEIKAQHWLNYYTDWLENNPLENILVLHYEHIQQNLK